MFQVCSQRIAEGAGGKGPRQKNVKKCQTVFRHFRHFSRRAKNGKKRQQVSRHFSAIFARHHFSGPFWGLLMLSCLKVFYWHFFTVLHPQSGKSRWGLSKWGLANGVLRYLSTIAHDCLRLSSVWDESSTKGHQSAHQRLQIVAPFESPHLDFPEISNAISNTISNFFKI